MPDDDLATDAQLTAEALEVIHALQRPGPHTAELRQRVLALIEAGQPRGTDPLAEAILRHLDRQGQVRAGGMLVIRKPPGMTHA